MNIEQKLVASVMSGLKALYGQDVPAAQIRTIFNSIKKETLYAPPFLKFYL